MSNLMLRLLDNRYVFILVLSAILCSHLVLTITFFIAYGNGYMVRVYINNYKEAHVELVLFIISSAFFMPMMLYITKMRAKYERL